MADDLTTQELDAVVKRIVDAVRPLRIVVFGSAARGEAGADSDIDVLVVMPDGTNRRETMHYLHTQFFGLPVAVDVVVATPSDLERHGRSPGLIYRTILDEGRELYAA